jgi:hypothetical protein
VAECRFPTARRKESPGILKVNLSQREQYRDCRNNDDEGHKREISRVDSFFALQVGRLVQISHWNLPLPTKAALSIRWWWQLDSDQKRALLTARLRSPGPSKESAIIFVRGSFAAQRELGGKWRTDKHS